MSTVYQFDSVSQDTYLTNDGKWNIDTQNGPFYYTIIPLEVGKFYKVTLQNVTTLSHFRVAQADSNEIGTATLSFMGYMNTPTNGYSFYCPARKNFLICYGGTANGGEVVIEDSKSLPTLQTLAGTTWKFNDTILFLANFTTFRVNFNVLSGDYYTTKFISIYLSSYLYYKYPYGGGTANVKVCSTKSVWYSEDYKTIKIIDGEDATNEIFIDWMLSNATLVEEEPTATVITYNGSTIATLEAGQTATIKTAETEVEHDIVVKAGGAKAEEVESTHALYNGVKLPKIPEDVLAQYPYAWIRKNTSSGNYDLVFAATSWFITTNMYCVEGESAILPWYTVPIATADSAMSWTFNKNTTGNFAVDADRPVFWSNHDIPNGFATDIYFEGTEPEPIEEEPEATETTPIVITYDGKEIASLKAGQTATVKCANTEADFDIVVSAKAEEDDSIVGTWVINDTVAKHAISGQSGYLLSITGTFNNFVNDNYILTTYNAQYLFASSEDTVIGTADTLTSGRANCFKSANTNCHWGSFYQEAKQDNQYAAHYTAVRTITITECDRTQEHYQHWAKWLKANATKQ